MRYVLIALLAASALAVLPVRSEETKPTTSLAVLERNTTTGSSRVAIYRDSARNVAKVKEDEFETPEMIATIEKNREDRERTVVMDR
ncbi:hypothetical protein [Bradyrhizobium sp. CB3481]|uniref:hypothetical protein n=1 Tax=Bradyrhizobium sp. CB3481 TaxID=3039158 RepID=UPI0024B05506|nr:hypothetical protein [Bradyrhizobium sp. CB3481]WFU18725.1 hypothetical protein QA643_10520 [Bradyrhizobium sp. CB3481]